MNVLHLAYRNTSGVPGRWAAAHRAAGIDTRLLVEYEHPFGYEAPDRVFRWSPYGVEWIAHELDWADAIMAYDHSLYLTAAIETGKPVLFRALGQSSRGHVEQIRELLNEPNVVRASAGTGDLALSLDIEMAGAPYPLPEPAAPEGLTLCHSPSDRDTKGTSIVLHAARETGWSVDLVEDVSNATVFEHKRRAALVVDSIGPGSIPDGYGVNGVEGMALGLPVITSASYAVVTLLRRAGSPAFYADDERELRDALMLLQDEQMRNALGSAGREFVEVFHSPEIRASEDIHALDEVLAAA